MCGLVNKKMNAQEVVEELTQVCIQMRSHLDDFTEQKDKKALILKHIKRFENTGAEIQNFPKGLEWFNVSEGLSLKQHLKGKIVLLDFFTYCCINCMHVLAELEEIEKTISIEDGLVVIGIHSAKFTNERSSKNVLSAVQRYNIAHPVVNDVTLRMWNNIGITCWPSLVMLGPSSQPLAVFVGEDHKNEILLYAKVMIAYFKSLNQISNHSLPLKPAYHLLPSFKNGLLFPGKLAILSSEHETKLIISDSGNNRIIMATEHGEVEHFIGGCNQGFKDGNFKNARFNSPQGVCVLDNTIYVADNNNHAIRKINLIEKNVSTIAGTGSQGYDRQGGKHGTNQVLSSPWDVAVYHHEYSKGSSMPILLIAIAGTHQIWALFLEDTIWWKEKKYTAGTCIAIVGSGREENRNNSYPHAAGLAQPSGIVVAQEYKIAFFADSESSAIRQLHLDSGRVSAVCGGDKNPANLHAFGDVDGKEYSAKLQHPLGIAWDHLNKRIYIADTYNHKIKTVDIATGYCKTLFGAGKPDCTFSFNEPSGLAVNPDSNILYVADTNNHALKIIDLENEKISTVVISKHDSNENIEKIFTFDTSINTHGGELNILFNIVFSNNLKLNVDAPQEWHVFLPANTWVANSLTGGLSTPVSIKLPADEAENQLRFTLNIMSCTVDTCIPLKLSVLFNVRRKMDAPTIVTEEKELVVD